MENQEEFIRIIRENEGIIFKITTVYAADKEDQKDLYQEIVYQLWKSFASFRNESRVSTWLYRVALNTSITHLKKEKKSGERVSIDRVLMERLDYHDAYLEERVILLYEHIKRLSTIEKAIVLLYLEGRGYDEIASITGFTPTNVGTRLSRIKQKLKSQIQNDESHGTGRNEKLVG